MGSDEKGMTMTKAWPFTRRAFVWAMGPSSGRRVADILAGFSIPVVLFQPGADPEDVDEAGGNGVRGLLRKVRGEEILRIEGHFGQFRIRIRQQDGAVAVCEAGFLLIHREAPSLEKGSRGVPVPETNTLTLEALEALASSEGSEGIPDSIGVWLDPCEGLPDRVSAERAFRALLGLKAKGNPECIVLCRHVPLWGLNGQQLYDDLREKGVRFLRLGAERPNLKSAEGKVELEVEDQTICDRPVRLLLDRVLVVGPPSPPAEACEIAERLADPLDREGFLQKDNAHLYPSRSFRKGIYYLGDCKEEQAAEELTEEVRAILPEVVAPIASGEIQAPEGIRIDKGHCVSCLTCYRVCPHHALDMSQGPVPVPLDPACYGCGLCAALCPGNAIELVRKPREAILGEPGEAGSAGQDAMRTVLFGCSRSGLRPAGDPADGPPPVPARTSVIEVPCACSVSEEMLLEAFLKGAERVVIVGCHPDNCVSQRGSSVGERRAQRVARYLAAGGRDSGNCVRFVAVAPNEAHRLTNILRSPDQAPPGQAGGSAPVSD